MSKRVLDKDPTTSTIGAMLAATLLGKSYDYFHDHIQYSEKFQLNVPNKTPNAVRPTYLRHDVERFRQLNEWF